MKKHLRKDQKIRLRFAKQELRYVILKSITQNENLPVLVKWNAILKLSSFGVNQNKIRLVNRCVLTSRKAKFNRIFKKFSRLSFLRLARTGTVSGLKKSSW